MGKSLITNQLLENKITFLMVYFVLLWYGNGHLLWDIYRIFMQYGIYVKFFSLIYAKNLVFSILYYTNPEIPSLASSNRTASGLPSGAADGFIYTSKLPSRSKEHGFKNQVYIFQGCKSNSRSHMPHVMLIFFVVFNRPFRT